MPSVIIYTLKLGIKERDRATNKHSQHQTQNRKVRSRNITNRPNRICCVLGEVTSSGCNISPVKYDLVTRKKQSGVAISLEHLCDPLNAQELRRPLFGNELIIWSYVYRYSPGQSRSL